MPSTIESKSDLIKMITETIETMIAAKEKSSYTAFDYILKVRSLKQEIKKASQSKKIKSSDLSVDDISDVIQKLKKNKNYSYFREIFLCDNFLHNEENDFLRKIDEIFIIEFSNPLLGNLIITSAELKRKSQFSDVTGEFLHMDMIAAKHFFNAYQKYHSTKLIRLDEFETNLVQEIKRFFQLSKCYLENSETYKASVALSNALEYAGQYRSLKRRSLNGLLSNPFTSSM